MTNCTGCSKTMSATLLLREVDHRVRNEMASAINLITVAALRADSAEVRFALDGVVEVMHNHAAVHCALRMPDRDGLVDAAGNLRKLVLAIGRSRLERLKINLVFAASNLTMEADRCWRLRLAVNELVTNAARHAHLGGRQGEIRVELARTGSFAKCTVSDNGAGAARVRPVRGLKIVGELAKSLGGRIGHCAAATGTSFALVIPLTERELQANNAAAERRRGQAGPLRRRPVSNVPSKVEESSRRENVLAEGC